MATNTTELFYTPLTHFQHTASLTINFDNLNSQPPYTPDRSYPCLDFSSHTQSSRTRQPGRPVPAAIPRHIEYCSSLPSSHWSHYSHLETYEVPAYPYTQPPPHLDGTIKDSNPDLTCFRLAIHNMLQVLPDVVFWTVNTVTFVVASPFLVVYEMGWLLVYIAKSAWKNGKKASFKKIWKGVKGWRGWGVGLQAFVALSSDEQNKRWNNWKKFQYNREKDSIV